MRRLRPDRAQTGTGFFELFSSAVGWVWMRGLAHGVGSGYPERDGTGKGRHPNDHRATSVRVTACWARSGSEPSCRVGFGSAMLASDMRFSLQVQYAICASFDLAYSGQGQPIQIRAIAARQSIPPRYLEQIFVRLRRARLVESKRGPGGGYRLARPAAEITLCEIIEAVEGPLVDSLEMAPPVTGANENRPDFLWSGLAERLSEALAATTLDTLCREAARANLPGADPPMYFI